MGVSLKNDGRVVVGIGIENEDNYKNSQTYRELIIKLNENGASEESVRYLEYLRDYAIYHNSLGEPLKAEGISIWVNNNGSTVAVEADDIKVDGSNVSIGGIKWDGSTWDYSNAMSGGGSGGGGAFVVNITAVDGETTIDKSYAEILSAHQAGSIIFAQIEADGLPDGLCTVILNFDEVFSRFISYYSTFNFVDDGEGTLVPEPVYMHAVVSVNAGETYAQITI